MSFLKKAWRIIRWLVLVLVVLFAALIVYRWPIVTERQKTQEAVANIHAAKLTENDVFGELPPAPDPVKNNATLAGIDFNNNGIRDDVERAIYAAHHDSARVTAAELQYAIELQNKLNGNVFNSDTWTAAVKWESRGSGCVIDTAFDLYKNTPDRIHKSDEWIKEINNFVFNTEERIKEKEKIDQYEVAYANTLDKNPCDIDPKTLPN
jgi:type II secretory pathway pseudopilin PulG